MSRVAGESEASQSIETLCGLQKNDIQYVERLVARVRELEREIALLQQDKALLERVVRHSGKSQ